MASQRLTAFVIDNDPTRAARLRAMMDASGSFKSSRLIKNIKDALREINSRTTVDVIFISSEFGDRALFEFVRALKKRKHGLDNTGLVLLATGHQQSRSVISAKFLVGFDSFLIEPYSTESLVDAAELSLTVKELKSSILIKPAIEDLVKTALETIDHIALRKARSQPYDNLTESLNNIRLTLGELDREQLKMFLLCVFEKVETSQGPSVSPRQVAEEKRRKEEEEKAQREKERRDSVKLIRT